MSNDEIEKLMPEELRLKIAKVKNIPLGTAQTHDFKHGYGPVRMVNAVTGLDVPNWPADITAAWELVEEMLYYDIKKIGPSVTAVLYPVKNLMKAKVGHGDTAPLAICRAYLYIAWGSEG